MNTIDRELCEREMEWLQRSIERIRKAGGCIADLAQVAQAIETIKNLGEDIQYPEEELCKPHIIESVIRSIEILGEMVNGESEDLEKILSGQKRREIDTVFANFDFVFHGKAGITHD